MMNKKTSALLLLACAAFSNALVAETPAQNPVTELNNSLTSDLRGSTKKSPALVTEIDEELSTLLVFGLLSDLKSAVSKKEKSAFLEGVALVNTVVAIARDIDEKIKEEEYKARAEALKESLVVFAETLTGKLELVEPFVLFALYKAGVDYDKSVLYTLISEKDAVERLKMLNLILADSKQFRRLCRDCSAVQQQFVDIAKNEKKFEKLLPAAINVYGSDVLAAFTPYVYAE